MPRTWQSADATLRSLQAQASGEVDEVAFLNTTMNQSDEEDEVDAALAEGRSSCTLGVPVGSDE